MMKEQEHSYHSHSSPYYYDAEGIKRHLVPGETLVGWMTTNHSRPLTQGERWELREALALRGESTYECPMAPYTMISGHSHETPENNGGVEHSHDQ